jgi:predicted nucleic acid-binding protein
MIVFADTFALIAWLSPRDTAHQLVTAYLDAFTGRLVTTEWVLIEFADALSAPEVRGTAVAFLRAVRADALFDVVRPAQKKLHRAAEGPIRCVRKVRFRRGQANSKRFRRDRPRKHVHW